MNYLDQYIRKPQFKYIVLTVCAFGILVIMLSSIFAKGGNAVNEGKAKPEAGQSLVMQNDSVTAGEQILEQKLVKILSEIAGAGQVTVKVTFEGGVQSEYAQNKVVESRTIQEKDSGGGTRVTTETKENGQIMMMRDTQTGGEKPILLREIQPSIKGVLVVADGAVDSQIKADLSRAVQTALGIPAYKVTVLPRKR